MISFVWSDNLPLYANRGGTESFTIGHIRELHQRGIPARVVSVGLGENDGREFYDDIEFHNLTSASELSELDDILVYVNFPFNVPTKRQSFVFFHFPPLDRRSRIINYRANLNPKSILLANSRYMRSCWAEYLGVSLNKIHIVYPFADPVYAKVKRPNLQSKKTRVLFAGRLMPEKGIFLLMEALHHNVLTEGFQFTSTTAGNQTYPGYIIERLLRCHPLIRVIKARRTPAEMARLYARHDIVVVPSNSQYWHEAFGMVSVEAQHAGCHVVASNADGLPETNCGELILFKPGNSYDLALKIARAAEVGPLLPDQRQEAIQHFTRAESVNLLLRVVDRFAGTKFL